MSHEPGSVDDELGGIGVYVLVEEEAGDPRLVTFKIGTFQ